jgi:hypothetical protein
MLPSLQRFRGVCHRRACDRSRRCLHAKKRVLETQSKQCEPRALLAEREASPTNTASTSIAGAEVGADVQYVGEHCGEFVCRSLSFVPPLQYCARINTSYCTVDVRMRYILYH